MNARAAVLPLLASLSACATDQSSAAAVPLGEPQVVIHVAGDGFVRVDDRRRPLDAIVLELRQRARTMTAEQRRAFVVEIRADPQPAHGEASRVAEKARNRLIDEIYVMGLGVVRL